MFDFSKYPLSGIRYGGSERKIGIKVGENNYMVKFQKKSPFGNRFNHISEYLGSKIFALLGYEAQQVYLGTYNGEEVVVCKDFSKGGALFVPFNDIGESTIEQDKEQFQYSYTQIMNMLKANRKLTNVEETISMFWEMFVIDALLGNFDRHGANWGFIKENDKYKLAPVFDNGSSLFPSIIDENKMRIVIEDEEETNQRVFKFPTSQIKLNGNKSSYYDVINSLQFEECNHALIKVYEKIDINSIFNLIDETIFISETHKEFLKHMLKKRYELIIKASYIKLMENKNGKL